MRAINVMLVIAFVILTVSVGMPVMSDAQAYPDRQVAGQVRSFHAESPHPLSHGWSEVYSFPGAKFLRLHFQGFDLAEGDKVILSNVSGTQAWEYTGRGVHGDGDFWSFAVDGDAVKVEVQAPSGRSSGFRIVDVGYGTVSLGSSTPSPEIVVGTDGREDVACHAGDPVVADTEPPVARLLFTVKRVQYLCTGELIRGTNANTLITNAHCIDSQTVVSTLEARFNYQYTTCGGAVLEASQSFAGGSFLVTNAERYNRRKANTGLDYTLLTLQGDPELAWGELVPTTASIAVATPMNFIQHGAGLPKKIGWWEDALHTVRCTVATVGQTYGASYPNSQIGYGCDSEGGSSGSAITRASDGKVIGLHHYGGVTTELNSATMMSLICANAGGRLICDAN
jgi:lysyl endopeptidase